MTDLNQPNSQPDPQQAQYAAASGQSETIGTVPPVTDTTGVASARRRLIPNRRLVVAIGAILVGLGLAGGAVAALRNLNSPGRELAAALANLGNVQSLQYEAQATIQIKQDGGFDQTSEPADDTPRATPRSTPRPRATAKPRSPLQTTLVPTVQAETVDPSPRPSADPSSGNQPIDVVLSAKGGIDITDQSTPKSAQTFSLTAQAAKVPVFNVGVEVRTIGTDGYAKLTEFSDFGFFDLSGLKNVWIKASEEQINQEVTTQTGREALDKLDERQVKELTAAAKESKVVKVKRLKNEDIDGVAARHYRYEIQKDRLRDFIPRANQIIYQQPLSEEETNEIADSFNSFEFLPGEAWVGKQDKLPHKMTLGISPKDKSTVGDVLLSISAKDFGRPVTVDVPEGAKTVEEASSLLETTSTGSTDSSTGSSSSLSDSRRKADLRHYALGLNQYKLDKGSYPKTPRATELNLQSKFLGALVPDYISDLRQDPREPQSHYYYASDGSKFGLCADSAQKPGYRLQLGPNSLVKTVQGQASACPLLN